MRSRAQENLLGLVRKQIEDQQRRGNQGNGRVVPDRGGRRNTEPPQADIHGVGKDKQNAGHDRTGAQHPARHPIGQEFVEHRRLSSVRTELRRGRCGIFYT